MGWRDPEPAKKKDAKDILAEEFSEKYIHHCSCGGAGFVRIGYDPETGLEIPITHPIFGVAVPCICMRDEAAKARAKRLREGSGMTDAELYDWRFETFDPKLCVPPPGGDGSSTIAFMTDVLHRCQRYAAHPEGWLVLQGPPGVGKTHLAYAIAGAQLRRDRPVYAHNVPEFMGLLRGSVGSSDYEYWLEGVKDVYLLVLDDLGAQRSTDWTDETLFQIINHRYAKRLPMVVTANWTLDEADNPIEARILSRLREGSGVEGGWTQVVNFPVQDYRPRAPRRDFHDPSV